MEIEQTRLDEYDGDSSRMLGADVDQEETEEMSLEYLLHRHNFGVEHARHKEHKQVWMLCM